MKTWSRIAAATALFSCATAHAGRPLTTEDAGVLDSGKCEIESFYSRSKERDTPRTTGRSVQLGCGTGLNTQFAIAAADSRTEGETTRELSLVGKTGLIPLKDDQAGLVIAYALGAQRPPTGGDYKHETTDVNLVLSVPLSSWLAHFNVGHARVKSTSDKSTTWAFALEWQRALGPIDLMVETYGDDHDPAWVAAAVRWAVVPERFFVDASYGMQTTSARPKLWTVGLKLSF